MSEKEVFIKVDVGLFKKGIAAHLSPNAFKTLLALSCYMDSEGNCFPSQATLCEVIGISKKTLRKNLDELLSTEIDDEPILTHHFASGNTGRRSVYKIHPSSHISIFNTKPKEVPKKIPKVVKKAKSKPAFNSHQALTYFSEKYKETYGDEYSPNFLRDCSLIKQKLTNIYKEEEIKGIIDILFEQYETKWKKDRYPRPTVVALCSFLINECLSIKAEREKKQIQETLLLQEAEKYKEQLNNMNEGNLPF